MSAPDPRVYGDAWAQVYDEWFGALDDTQPAVAVLADLAGGGTALEVGAGTGRLAVPLAAAGCRVIAVEPSPAMAARLRPKVGDLPVEVVEADVLGDAWARHVPDGGLHLAYLSCNTLYQLTDARAQADCLRLLARRLAPGGRVVVEASVPDLALLQGRRRTTMQVLDGDRVAVTTVRADPAAQTVDTDTVLFDGADRRVLPVRERFVWPAELDLMARLAGLDRRWRWSGWERGAFGAGSTGHVTGYARAA